MPRSETYKAIAQRLGIILELKETFSYETETIAFILNRAVTDHAKAKRTAESLAKRPDRHTQGGAAGMASSMYDHMDRILEGHIARYMRSRNPETKAAAKKAHDRIREMREWWDAAFKKWAA